VSLNELSKRTGISKGHLSTIENNDVAAGNVTLLLAAKLTQAFGMPLWHVLKITAKSP
jgi:transcriptional regulator with XRE-family HTH domain